MATTTTRVAGPPGGFFGREVLLSSLAEFQAQGSARLVTLVGLGGAGKTRLALEHADRVAAHLSGGVRFVELGGARGVDDVVRAVAAAMGLALTDRAPAAQLRWALAACGPTLLVLDGFEGVVDAAEATVGAWAPASPELNILVTSRVRLGVEGEQVVEVGPLEPAAAASLLCSRAGRGALDPALEGDVVAVVRRLDHLPLALELTGAALRARPPGERRAALREVLSAGPGEEESRRPALWRVLEGSWALLPIWARLALAQATVFRGGFALEHAEAILQLEALDGAPWVVDVLQTLVDHSLVVARADPAGAIRFSLLDTVFAFAAARMGDPEGLRGPDGASLTGPGPLAALRRRHAEVYAALGTSEALHALDTRGGAARRRALVDELENLQAGLSAALDLGAAEVAARLALAVAEITTLRGPLALGLGVLEPVLSLPGLRDTTRAHALIYLGRLRYSLGDTCRALDDVAEAEALAERVGAAGLQALACIFGGIYNRERGNPAEALRLLHEAIRLARASGDRMAESYASGALGITQFVLGDLPQANQWLELGLQIAREVGDRRREGSWLGFLGGLANDQCDYPRARSYMEQALEILLEVGDRQNALFTVGNLGTLLRAMGQNSEARARTGEALRLARQLGARRSVGIWEANLGILCHRLGEHEEARDRLERGVRLLEEAGARRVAVIMLGYLGELLADMSDPSAEARLRESVEGCEAFQSPAGASFGASLAVLRARAGDLAEARALLDRGEAALRQSWPPEHAQVLLHRVAVERAAGDPVAAAAALDEARAIVDRLGLPERSELMTALRRVEASGADAPAPG